MERAARTQWRDRLILENALDYAILTTDMNGVIDSWSAGAHNLFGWREEEIIGKSLDTLFTYEDQADGLPAKRREMARQHRLDPVERWHLRKDGSKFWASGDLQLFQDENGAPWGFLKIVRDRTSERQHQEALRLSEERAHLAQEAGGIGSFSIDVDRGIILATPKFMELLGLEIKPELAIEEFLDVIVTNVSYIASQMLNPPDDKLVSLEIQIQRSDNNERRWIAFRAEKAPIDIGEMQGHRPILGVIQDVTARRLAQDKREMLAQELAHRVKNTLAMVQSICNQSLNNAANIEEARRILTARIKALADAQDILTHGASSSINLHEIIVNCLEGNIGLTNRFTCNGPKAALDSEAALSMSLALHEFATNAVKYGALSNEQGRVDITWDFDDGKFHFAWHEIGGPEITKQPTRKGFGAKLVERLLPASLNGEAKLDYAPNGFSYHLTAPISDLIKPH
ncbi:sensor histidine kinase [Bartonella sp. HY761]|uniref:sensor histidine kinase n=1 Tax=Bartonella sp. HY761 TaxID=2979330 RepID=UPI002205F775|nr:HWE histidine kinase domain-containing protein [Bartonella sp. HY761]UXN06116.1 PAS domain S-box protein [Bartonella sp. HY761]